MPGGQARMIKVIGWIVPEAQLLHDAAGRAIAWYGEGHELLQPELSKSVPDHGTRAFRSQPLPPMGRRQAPADLHARREVGFKRGHHESDEAGEFARLAEFGGPKPKTVLLKMLMVAVNQRVTLGAGEHGGEIPHDQGISV